MSTILRIITLGILIFLWNIGYCQPKGLYTINGIVRIKDPRQSNSSSMRILIHVSKFPFRVTDAAKMNSIKQFVDTLQSGDTFQIRFSSENEYVYMNVQGLVKGNFLSPFYNDHNIYLLRKGDNIKMEIFPDSIRFSGFGSNRLNCQSQIFATVYYGNLISTLINAGRYEDANRLDNKIMDSILEERLKILDTYKAKLSSSVLNILRNYSFADRYYQIFFSTYISTRISGIDAIRSQNLLKYYSSNYASIMKNIFCNNKNDEMYLSPIVSNMIIEKYILDIIVTQKKQSDSGMFDDIYQRVMHDYPKGALRDQLITLCYITYRKGSFSAMANITNAIQNISDADYKMVLQELNLKENKGSPFTQFALPDVHGKTYTLDSLASKVSIIDFWFTGCENCILLKKAMQPIFEKYRDDSLFSFVSISIDRDSIQWKKSVASHKYTDDSGINLYTKGMGGDHELIKNYHISSYPKQMILVDGKVFESNPPSPINKMDYLAVLKQALVALKASHTSK